MDLVLENICIPLSLFFNYMGEVCEVNVNVILNIHENESIYDLKSPYNFD